MAVIEDDDNGGATSRISSAFVEERPRSGSHNSPARLPYVSSASSLRSSPKSPLPAVKLDSLGGRRSIESQQLVKNEPDKAAI